MKNYFISLRDTTHAVIAKFVKANLPDAKKPYNARAVLETELTLEEIAEKAAVYNVNVAPDRIVQGVRAFFTLCCYLSADGYKLRTPLFYSRMRIPGEYAGHETHMNPGEFPVVKMETSGSLREYIKERMKVKFDGIMDTSGYMSYSYDVDTKTTDLYMTDGGVVEIHGDGLKIMGDEEHKDQVGLFIVDDEGEERHVTAIGVNEPKLVSFVMTNFLYKAYTLVIRTQTSTKTHGGHLLKDIHEIRSDFTLMGHWGPVTNTTDDTQPTQSTDDTPTE
ncbi:MAG: DUF4469 domain-containing protein [Tannerellaceae bacterium]|jgi:hypothetical protein|nr:DUF4469 domain-containing protein [Tannerellaceae bacterium]